MKTWTKPTLTFLSGNRIHSGVSTFGFENLLTCGGNVITTGDNVYLISNCISQNPTGGVLYCTGVVIFYAGDGYPFLVRIPEGNEPTIAEVCS